MAITTVSAIYATTAPTKSGQVIAGRDPDSRVFRGTATVTGDGASSSFIFNLVDGTETIPFTPSGGIVFRSGGAATGTITVLTAVFTNTICTVTTSAAVNAATFIVSFEYWK